MDALFWWSAIYRDRTGAMRIGSGSSLQPVPSDKTSLEDLARRTVAVIDGTEVTLLSLSVIATLPEPPAPAIAELQTALAEYAHNPCREHIKAALSLLGAPVQE